MNFDYQNLESTNLYANLSKVICKNTKESKRFINYKNDNRVIYHTLEPMNALNINLNVGTTADGNNRQPELSLQLVEANKSSL